ncbi:MAG TPA: hypothetical protein VHO70_20245 [Chitinispirillaceae bacterium]|nr:hypothetical protein [Chitinispirillaceae bacterium]
MKNFINIKELRNTLAAILLLLWFLSIYVNAQDSSGVIQDTVSSMSCSPEVVFNKRYMPISVCLNNYIPQDDSCCEIEFLFKNPDTKITFYYDIEKHWTCVNFTADSSAGQQQNLNAVISYDEKGILTKAVFSLDSQQNIPELLPSGEVKPQADTLSPVDYEINRRNFTCRNNVIIGKLVIRDYTYPPGYGKREQILNYPEISAFHHGGSVHMVKDGQVQLMGYILNYWHIQNPPPIKYDDPEQIRKYEIYLNKWRERRPLREKKPKKTNSFFKIKPL